MTDSAAVRRLGAGPGWAGDCRLPDPQAGGSSPLDASGVVAQTDRAAGIRRSWNHARPGLLRGCWGRSGYPLVAGPGGSLHSGATSEQRAVRVGRRRSVTTSTGQVAGSSPVVTTVECRGVVAQSAEQLPAVTITPTRPLVTKSGPEFLRLSGDGSAGSSPAARGRLTVPGNSARRQPAAVTGGRIHVRSFAPLTMAVAGRSEIGYLSHLEPSEEGKPERSGPAGSHPTPAAAVVCPGGGLAWMSCGR